MNINLWAKLRLYKNTDGSIMFINLENSDISDLLLYGTDFINSDRFTLHPGEIITVYKSLCTIKYIGLTNNSILFEYEWWGSNGYVTIPFGENDIRVCTYATDEEGLVPIKTEVEYGNDLDFSLNELKKYLNNQQLPEVVVPAFQTYLLLDSKYTTFIDDNALKERLNVMVDDVIINSYRYTNLEYAIFVKLEKDCNQFGKEYLKPVVTEIYCKHGHEKDLAERIIYMLQGEFEEKVEIASL